MKNTKSNLAGSAYWTYRLQSTIRKASVGTEAENMENQCLLAYLTFPDLLSYLSYTIQDHLPKSGPTQRARPSSTINEQCPTDIPTKQCGGGKSSAEGPSSWAS